MSAVFCFSSPSRPSSLCHFLFSFAFGTLTYQLNSCLLNQLVETNAEWEFFFLFFFLFFFFISFWIRGGHASIFWFNNRYLLEGSRCLFVKNVNETEEEERNEIETVFENGKEDTEIENERRKENEKRENPMRRRPGMYLFWLFPSSPLP